MNKPQQLLLSFLMPPFLKIESAFFEGLSESDVAKLFVDSSFLISAAEYMRESYWLGKKSKGHQEPDFAIFLKKSFTSEMASLSYLQDYFLQVDTQSFKEIEKRAEAIESAVILFVMQASPAFRNDFIRTVLYQMVQQFNVEATLQEERHAQGQDLALTMYRTFDRLDEVLGLDYEVEKSVISDLKNKERLYEGAGVGVQSSYSTLLTALREIAPPEGARFIDLGSGYGRVGLVLGFLRPDIDFVGYEYVPQRVEISKLSSQSMGLSQHVQFQTQDLSDKNFYIPKADIYYLYDPFSEETYRHVLAQLVEISKTQPIVIATKGNAKEWLKNVAAANGWPAPQEFADDNLCLFRSYAAES